MAYTDDKTAEAEFDAALRKLSQTPATIRDRRRSRIVSKIESLERELQLLDSLPVSESPATLLDLPVESNGDSLEPVNLRRVPRNLIPDKPTKPQGILQVISEERNRSWKVSEVRDVMVERNWVQSGPGGTKQIQNTFWQLKNRGELESPSTGYYRITPKGMEAISGQR